MSSVFSVSVGVGLDAEVGHVGERVAGLYAFEPRSYGDFVVQGLERVADLGQDVLSQLSRNDANRAFASVRHARLQLEATGRSVADARSRGQIAAGKDGPTLQAIAEAEALLQDVEDRLGGIDCRDGAPGAIP